MSSASPHFEACLALLDVPEYVELLMKMGATDPDLMPIVAQTLLARSRPPIEALAVWIETLEVSGEKWNDVLESVDGVEGEQVAGLRQFIDAASRLAADSERGIDERLRCFPLLGRIPKSHPKDRQLLLGLLEPQYDHRLRSAALTHLERFDDAEVATRLRELWRSLVPPDRPVALSLLLSRRNWSVQLMEAIESGEVLPSEVGASQRQQLIRHSDPSIGRRASAIFNRKISDAGDSRLLALQAAITRNGDSARGRRHFEQRCGICHELAGIGRAIGPNLRSVSDRTPSSFLSSIVQPNQSVEPKYIGYDVSLKDGRQLYGMVVRETGAGITFRHLDGSESTVLRRHIEALRSSSTSFMPEGLADGMSVADMADLLAFLRLATH